jgi:hypothetical protein
MIEFTAFIVLAELLIVSMAVAIWIGVKRMRERRAYQQAGDLFVKLWSQHEYLHQEVIRKRLLALYPSKENVAQLIEAVLERERVLVQQVAQGLVKPSAENLTVVINGINRYGDVYCQTHKETDYA